MPRGRSLPVTGLASQSVVGGPPHMHTRSCNMIGTPAPPHMHTRSCNMIGAPAPPHMHTMHTRRCSMLGAPAPPYMHTSRSCNMLGVSAPTTHAYQELRHHWRTRPHHTCIPGVQSLARAPCTDHIQAGMPEPRGCSTIRARTWQPMPSHAPDGCAA